MINYKRIFILGTTLLMLAGCRKDMQQAEQKNQKVNATWYNVDVPDNFFKVSLIPGVATQPDTQLPTQNVANFTAPDPENGDQPVVLGRQLNNPYTVQNMKAACLRLYGNNSLIHTTHLYVRFKPANTDELSILLDDDNLELQDYPMDYEVITEGNYYQDPTIGREEIGWLYLPCLKIIRPLLV